MLKNIENAEYYITDTDSTLTEIAVMILGIDTEILTISDDSKKLIIEKVIEKLPENGLIGYGYILHDCTVYCYTDKYFVGFKAVAGTKLTSEDLSEALEDFRTFKNGK